jgi:hypothetical protein
MAPDLSGVNGTDSKKSINVARRKRLVRSRELTRDDLTGVGGKQRSSRVLHRIGEASEHAAAGSIAAGALLTWIGVGSAVGIATEFPPWWENVFLKKDRESLDLPAIR